MKKLQSNLAWDALKIRRLDASGLNDLMGLKKKNKELRETRIDWP